MFGAGYVHSSHETRCCSKNPNITKKRKSIIETKTQSSDAVVVRREPGQPQSTPVSVSASALTARSESKGLPDPVKKFQIGRYYYQLPCRYCGALLIRNGITRHEKACRVNPNRKSNE